MGTHTVRTESTALDYVFEDWANGVIKVKVPDTKEFRIPADCSIPEFLRRSK